MSIQEKKYISKKTGKTYTKYFAVVNDPETNKKIWSKGYDKRKEAQKMELELVTAIENGTRTTIDKKKKFGALAEEWIEIAPTLYANSTYRCYKQYLHTYIMPVFEDKKLSMITPMHIQKYITLMSKKYSPETVNKSLNILSNIYQFGMSLSIVEGNPCEKIKRLRVQTNKHTTWSELEIMYFFNQHEVRVSPYYDMLILSFIVGLRPSEVCGISESDFMNSDLLTITRGFDKYGVISNLKTNASHRPIELSKMLVDLMKKRVAYKALLRKTKHQYSDYNENDFLFTHENGNPVNPNTLSENFRKLLNSHNRRMEKILNEKGSLPEGDMILPTIRLYDARHSFATNSILSNNASIKVISEILGHSNIKTTLHNYSHVSQSMSKKVIDEYTNKILGQIIV